MLCTVILIGLPAAAPAQGPEDNLSAFLQLTASDIRAKTNEIVSGIMNFTAAEGEAFWPLYRKYEFENGNIADQSMALIKDYKANFNALDDAKAKELAEKVFKLDEQKVRLNQKYYREFSKILPSKRTTQLFQLLRRIDLLVDLKTATMLPMIGEDW
jgi:hypothetical protein